MLGKKITKISKIFTNAILIGLVLVGILVVFSFVPFPGNYKIYTVQSGSMEPTIHTGSLIFTKAIDEYQVGDVVTRKTKDPKITVTHRVIKKEKGEFITKGDANDHEDRETFSKEDFIGKVYLVVPYLGYPVSFAKTMQGLILIIIIPSVIIIYDEMQKIKKEIRKKIDYRKRVKKRQSNNSTEQENEDNEE